MRRAFLSPPSSIEAFRRVAVDLHAILLGPPAPWRFHMHNEEGWRTPAGNQLVFVDLISLGRTGVRLQIDDETEGASMLDALDAALPLRDGPELLRAWSKAHPKGQAPKQALAALLDLAAWGYLCVVPLDDEALVDAWRAALDHSHPVVRLAAMRNLFIFTPRLRVSLLEGREDADNPGLVTLRDHFAAQLA